jgi:hypothetical protein
MRPEDEGLVDEQWPPQVVASIAATLALMWGDDVDVYPGRIRVREEWPRTTLWRWL